MPPSCRRTFEYVCQPVRPVRLCGEASRCRALEALSHTLLRHLPVWALVLQHPDHAPESKRGLSPPNFLHRGIQFALEVQKASGKKLADFLKAIDEKANADKLAGMCSEVEAFAGAFPMPGH